MLVAELNEIEAELLGMRGSAVVTMEESQASLADVEVITVDQRASNLLFPYRRASCLEPGSG